MLPLPLFVGCFMRWRERACRRYMPRCLMPREYMLLSRQPADPLQQNHGWPAIVELSRQAPPPHAVTTEPCPHYSMLSLPSFSAPPVLVLPPLRCAAAAASHCHRVAFLYTHVYKDTRMKVSPRSIEEPHDDRGIIFARGGIRKASECLQKILCQR